MIPVIFRKFSDGEVIALFPTLPGTNDPATCQSYLHVGQHGAADVGITGCTKLATESEYAALLLELVAIGYDDLRIVRRFPANAWDLRRQAVQS